ncbi:MAG: hypothetical protein OXP71_04325 [Candidatus Poribacteria bacterium]|nr:hypothetical protein [Candidatus Poribacteria bacterium]
MHNGLKVDGDEGFGPPLRVSYRERVSATEVEGDIGFSCAKDA